MLYNYYMKKIFYWLCSVCCILFTGTSFAQMTVVRVDGKKIYLDTSSLTVPAQKGNTFKVILSSEPLTNPKTGKNLGQLYHYSVVGIITEVQPLYAVGELPSTASVHVGQDAVWENTSSSAMPAAEEKLPISTRAKTVYTPLEQTVVSLTQADVTAANAGNIITLSPKQVTVFSRAGKDTLREEMFFALPSGKKGLTVSAAPIKEERVQIFVTVFAPSDNAISTLVLENQNGQLVLTDTLPYFVKELGCGDTKTVWAQRPFVLEHRPSNARTLEFVKNKWQLSKQNLNTRNNWLTGLNIYPVEKAGIDNLITTASDGELRLFLSNGKQAVSKDLFGSTPNRVSYKQEIVKFYPSLQAFGTPGEATLAAVENTTKMGLLSKAFGQYHTGKIHFLSYEKGRLKITDTLELDGVIYDTTCTDTSILTAEALNDGTSSVVEILK